MRVLQLIDSLDPGGAERVAVNIANVLVVKIEASFLCATRKEGLLKESLSNDVRYLFLNKKERIDFSAIRRLNEFVKVNKIQIIHAHSTSFFLAILIKLLNKNISIIWHDHYGNSEFLKDRKFNVLKFCSKFFSHVFSVNKDLEVWAKQKLKIVNVTYLPNFAIADKNLAVTNLKGILGKRIVSLANLRLQKDHFTLIKAFKKVIKGHPEWTLHFVGKDFKDEYSKNIKAKIKELDLENSIFLYDTKPDVFNVLSQCEIGVLSSKSEGLPIALLEYGLSNLAVVATKVGECETVISNNYNGILVNSCKENELFVALSLYIENDKLRETYSIRYNKHIQENYSKDTQFQTILEIYKSTIK